MTNELPCIKSKIAPVCREGNFRESGFPTVQIREVPHLPDRTAAVVLEATELSIEQKLMKQTAISDAHLRRIEAEVEMQIRALFGRCPELAGFAVQYLEGLSHDNDRSDEDPTLFVTDVGFSATVSSEEIEEVYTLIGTAISNAMSERPEAFELLRGRTFARTLH